MSCGVENVPAAVERVKFGRIRHAPGQWQQNAKVGLGALEIVGLFVVTETAEEKCEPDKSVQHEHDHGKHRVSGEAGIRFAGEHDGGDDRDLDAHHAERQHECAERFAELMGDHVSVSQHREGCP